MLEKHNMKFFDKNIKKRNKRKIGIVMAIFFCLILMLEVSLRIKHKLSQVDSKSIIVQQIREQTKTLVMRYSSVPNEYKPYLLWRTVPGKVTEFYKINSRGLRGHEFSKHKESGVYRIVMVGGSAAWGWGASSNETTIEGYLERYLNDIQNVKQIEVLNFAQSGYTSSQEIILWREILEYDPDLIIHYTGFNDIYIGFLGLSPGWNYPEIQEGVLSEDMFSVFFKAFRLKLKAILNATQGFMESFRLYSSIEYRLKLIFESKNKTRVAFSNSSDIADIFSENMYFSTKVAESYDASILIFLQPVLLIDKKPLTDWENALLTDYESSYPGRSSYYLSTYDLMVQKLKERGVIFVDGSSVFGGVNANIYLDTVHYFDQGNELIAKKIGDIIVSNGFLLK